ncbi:MAG: thioredoxin domain-containing protein, partial [Pirellulaceae bacterium]|nr:thioredoxin domain-containing protein [Pirellulaceae bacterium]
MSRTLLILLLLTTPYLVPAGAANALKDQTSFYLRDHSTDPVNWHPWGDPALAAAKKENKPIYVCIGAFTSELSRAMHRQSFTNAQVAEALNRDFICILVDREERPDLAALFQSYVQANKQLSGWPTNVWLTPDLKPFDGATYLPPSEEWGKEGVANVVKRVAAAWQDAPESVQLKAEEGVATAIAAETGELGPPFSTDAVKSALTKATASWLEHYDKPNGGFGETPRFTEPELLRFLLRTPGPGRDAAIATLRAIDRGALHDPLDGGFFHKIVDPAWQFPSFQKQLGDQARLALAFLDAARLADDASFANTARSALDYGLTRLAGAQGGCIHAEDATAEDLVSSFAWTQAEITTALGEKEAESFVVAYGVKAEGNVSAENDPGSKWKGHNLLYRVGPVGDAASEIRLAAARAKLLVLRDQRARPLRDEAVMIGENGLWLSALARAGQQLKEPRYREAAHKLADFLQTHGRDLKTRQPLRIAGNPSPGAADDYAFLALGIESLNAADREKNV